MSVEYERMKALAEADPEQFRKLMAELRSKTVIPHAAQAPVIQSEARFKVMNCGRRFGKFLRFDEPVLTPGGWKSIGSLSQRDYVLGSDGNKYSVTGVFPQGVKPLVTLRLKDGTEIECGLEHLWTVRRRWRKGRSNPSVTLTTQEMLSEGLTIDRSDGRLEHRFAIEAIQAAQHPVKCLPLEPYTLGALLGDGSLGHSTPILSSTDTNIPNHIRSMGYDVRPQKTAENRCPNYSVCGITAIVKSLHINVRSEHKHVPSQYFTASISQRLELLRGLMDTDGWLEGEHGRRCAFASASKQLIDDVKTLVLSLGGKVTPIQTKSTTNLDSFVIRFYMPYGENPFRLRRKSDRWTPTPQERLARQIVAITPSKSAESFCISVDAPDSLYITRNYTLTHNTVIAAKIIVAKTRKSKQMLWWCAPTYKIVKRGYAEVLKQLPDGVLTHVPPPDSNFDAGRSVILRFKNGTRMEFYSAERPEGMLGAGVDYVILDEAATMPSRVYNQIISPTLMDREGGCLMISTPRGQNWFYQCWLRGQDPLQKDWASWTFTTQDNPTLPPGEADRMAADMPRMEADQEIFAKWLAAGSSVFYIDDKAVQKLPGTLEDPLIGGNGLIQGFAPRGYVVLGIDLARTNDYTVFYGNRMSDRRCCYFERMQDVTWPEQKRRVRRAVKRLLDNGAENVMLLMDSTGVGDPIYEDLEAEGYDTVPINFSTHKTNMVRLLSKDLEEGQAFVLADAGLEEFRSYMMTMSAAGRMTYSAPEGQHDDIVSAKMLAHWGTINEGFGDIQVISEKPTGQEYSDEDAEFEEDYSDLLDLDEGTALEQVGLVNPYKRPTAQQLMQNPDAWF